MSDIVRLTMNYIIDIRDRRQVTLPNEFLQALSLAVGDQIALEVKEKKAIIKPLKTQALNTLKAIQTSFKKARLSEKELQNSGQKIRQRLVKQIYG